MITAELYKVRTHRTPKVVFGALLLAALIPSAVLTWYTPSNTDAYLTAFTATWSIVSILMAVVFAGWILGTEYRQDTVKRLLTSEPRRMVALGSKASVGGGVLAAGLAATASLGWLAARVVASINDVTIVWNGRELLAAGVTALAAGAMAFGLAAITRSDSFAMLGTVGTLLVLDPLLQLIPKVGQYSFGSALGVISSKIDGSYISIPGELSVAGAVVTGAAWLGALLVAGALLFARRDV